MINYDTPQAHVESVNHQPQTLESIVQQRYHQQLKLIARYYLYMRLYGLLTEPNNTSFSLESLKYVFTKKEDKIDAFIDVWARELNEIINDEATAKTKKEILSDIDTYQDLIKKKSSKKTDPEAIKLNHKTLNKLLEKYGVILESADFSSFRLFESNDSSETRNSLLQKRSEIITALWKAKINSQCDISVDDNVEAIKAKRVQKLAESINKKLDKKTPLSDDFDSVYEFISTKVGEQRHQLDQRNRCRRVLSIFKNRIDKELKQSTTKELEKALSGDTNIEDYFFDTDSIKQVKMIARGVRIKDIQHEARSHLTQLTATNFTQEFGFLITPEWPGLRTNMHGIDEYDELLLYPNHFREVGSALFYKDLYVFLQWHYKRALGIVNVIKGCYLNFKESYPRYFLNGLSETGETIHYTTKDQLYSDALDYLEEALAEESEKPFIKQARRFPTDPSTGLRAAQKFIAQAEAYYVVNAGGNMQNSEGQKLVRLVPTSVEGTTVTFLVYRKDS